MENEQKFWLVKKGVFTPGGDPCYYCPVCGKGEHINGIEMPKHLDNCPDCGTRLLYPGEHY